jgi:hypothetical protein
VNAPVTSTPAKSDAAPTETKKRGPKPRATPKKPLKSPADVKGSLEARRFAAAILEVLAGVRSTRDAADALGISETRYYVTEARAIQALVVACEPKKKGWQGPSIEQQLQKAKREQARAERERDRLRGLVRAAQRTIGLAPPPAKLVTKSGKTRKKRRPVVRALVAADALRKEPPIEPQPPATSPDEMMKR